MFAPGYRTAPTLALCLQPSHFCIVLSEQERCQIFCLSSSFLLQKKKNQQKNPNPQLLQTLFKSELEPIWHFCGWDLAWAQQSRDVEEALSLAPPALRGGGRFWVVPEVLRLLLAPLPPTRSAVLSGSEHCSVFRTICSKHSGPECGDLGSGGGSEPALPHSSFTGIPCGPFPLVQGRPSPAALPQVWILGIPGHLRLPLRAQPPPAVPGLPR